MKPPGSGLLFVGRLFSVSTLVLVIGLFISFERLYFILEAKKNLTRASHLPVNYSSNHQSNNHIGVWMEGSSMKWMEREGRKKEASSLGSSGSKTAAQKTILKATQLSHLEHQLFLSVTMPQGQALP